MIMATIKDGPGGLSEERLARLETRWGFILPTTYRDFLLTYNGGFPEPDAFTLIGTVDGSSVDRFLGVDVGPNSNLEKYLTNYESRLPPDLFPIAHDPG